VIPRRAQENNPGGAVIPRRAQENNPGDPVIPRRAQENNPGDPCAARFCLISMIFLVPKLQFGNGTVLETLFRNLPSWHDSQREIVAAF
jgi:hypothetical protein